jgi:hypothetical protein
VDTLDEVLAIALAERPEASTSTAVHWARTQAQSPRHARGGGSFVAGTWAMLRVLLAPRRGRSVSGAAWRAPHRRARR